MEASTSLPSLSARAVWRPLVWRAVGFTVVYLAAVAGFLSGVGVTERTLAGASLAEIAYYSAGLFVLGGMDLGVPVGGPDYGRALLWSAYFIAPVITASALVEAAVRLISPLALRVRPLSNHVVVAGAGRLSMLYIRKLRERDPRSSIVVVERNPNHPALAELRDVYRAMIVNGDITSKALLERLRTDRARRVLLLTGDDFTNLDTAAKILRQGRSESRRIVVHISDLGFMRDTSGSSVARSCETFNGHEFAATRLMQQHILGRFHSTPNQDLVVLAGFGRFGQTVLYELQQHAQGDFGKVIIVDEHASANARTFDDQVGFADDYDRLVVDGDILHSDVWDRIGAAMEEDGTDPVIILGSGNDGTNLHAAVLVHKRYPSAYTIVRTFRASPFAVEMTKEMDVHTFDLTDLIQSGMPDRWF